MCWVLPLLLGLALSGNSRAAAEEVTARLSVAETRLVPGLPVRVTVEIEIAAPWHINANPASAGLIPTELILAVEGPLTAPRVHYPAGHLTRVGWSDETVALYSGKIAIIADARVRTDLPVGPRPISVTLRYQACDDETCLLPKTIVLTREAEVVAGGGDLPVTTASAGSDNSIETLVRERGWVLALVIVFLGGLALNLTPCVYPMIAITVSYFGGQGEQRTLGRAFGHALVYCLGIVLTYSLLGLLAAQTGGLFGALLQSPVVLVGIALLLVALALSMFGLYELRPPAFLVQKAAGLSAQAGYLGVFFLGATVGVIAAPCLAPILVALLAYVGQRADPWLGWWLFFVLACGLGLPYIVLGTFSGLLAKLPRSGTWMVWVKRVFGVALIAVALWFVKPLVASRSAPASPIAWQPYTPELVATADRPVLIDFYADWCIPCHEMDQRTFTDDRIIEASKRFLMVKADLTKTGAPEVEQLTARFRIVGVPTFVFLGADGRERSQLRQVGFVPADEFLSVMNRALTAAAPTNAVVDPTWETPPALLRQF